MIATNHTASDSFELVDDAIVAVGTLITICYSHSVKGNHYIASGER